MEEHHDNNHVVYIPRQSEQDALLTSSRAAVNSPWRLLLIDIAILFKNLPYIPNTLLPFRSLSVLPNAPPNPPFHRILDYTLITLVSLLSLAILPLALLATLVLPGILTLALLLLTILLTIALSRPLSGPLLLTSQTPLPTPNPFPHERWLYINGIATTSHAVQTTLNRLSATFRRPITGVHNRTLGIPLDIAECLAQRCLCLATRDVRTCYEYLKLTVLDPSVKRVVVVAHSQGGIIVALALDRLYVEVSAREVRKVEVYTFGSAAGHFNNPLFCEMVRMNRPAGGEEEVCVRRVPGIETVEHYMNELDLVPRWGVRYNTTGCPEQRYAGRVFINKGASGHLFDLHYLDVMFPVDGTGRLKEGGFLDGSVDIDERRKPEGLHDDVERYVEDGGLRWVITREEPNGSGRTVKQLSRLWKYVGGGTP